ncbi:MAG: AmmeMemoRadiSam system protein B [Alphaproteobacteria bacterium]|nr:AmmeMemoRadiSam system protein B [Alphaproteobacteria bacterium]
MATQGTFEHVRSPAVAGFFYPEDPGELRSTVEAYLADARQTNLEDPDTPWPKAVIAPHAGYVYSGPVAASVYARLEAARETVERVVLLGPSHRIGFTGLAVSSAEAYVTPLGPIPIDARAIAQVAGFKQVRLMDEAHAQEHSLEAHLPFLQTVLRDFQLVPVVVGDVAPDDVTHALDALWGGPETLIVISSDLSHYHDYATANEMDNATGRAIQTLQMDGVTTQGACGGRLIRGLMALARCRDLRITLIDLRNSGDTAGPRDRVVGYGSFIVEEGERQHLSARFRKHLGDIAHRAIRTGLSTGKELNLSASMLSPRLSAPRASFVTLERDGCLRGCIGSLFPHQPLATDVAKNAFRAAFKDPRFEPLTEDEYEGIDLTISILSAPVPLKFTSEEDLIGKLRPGIDGLVLEDGKKRSTFMPRIWKHHPEASVFLRHLKAKAGLEPDYWADTLRVWRYITESFVPAT